MKKLSVEELQSAIFKKFKVNSLEELEKNTHFHSSSLSLAAEYAFKYFQGEHIYYPQMDITIEIRNKDDFCRPLYTEATWEELYRNFIGILPHEMNAKGSYCVNGVNIFYYFKPWQVFGLKQRTATKEDVESAFGKLFEFYFPDKVAIARLDFMRKWMLKKIK